MNQSDFSIISKNSCNHMKVSKNNQSNFLIKISKPLDSYACYVDLTLC